MKQSLLPSQLASYEQMSRQAIGSIESNLKCYEFQSVSISFNPFTSKLSAEGVTSPGCWVQEFS